MYILDGFGIDLMIHMIDNHIISYESYESYVCILVSMCVAKTF